MGLLNLAPQDIGNGVPTRDALSARSTVAAITGINTTETYVTPAGLIIPAGSLVVGDAFFIQIAGRNTSTATGSNTFRPKLGSAGTTADTSLTSFVSNNAGSGTNIPFIAEFWVIVRAIGASGSIFSYGRVSNSGTVGIATTGMAISTGGSTTINTTGQLILGASLVSSATTSTSVVEHGMVTRL
jgi:hypothetical protein